MARNRFNVWLLIVVGTIVYCGQPNGVAAETLQTGIVEWQPYQIYGQGSIGGIVIDILREVSSRTGHAIEYRKLPQKRMLDYFRKGTITLEPASNPAWRKRYDSISRYSIPYLPVASVVLMRRGSRSASRVQDFHGKVLGCVLGYHYSDGFEQAFAQGAIKRYDAVSMENNFKRFALKRVDGIIVDRLVGKYWIQHLNMNPDDFEEVYTLKNSTSVFMRIHISQEQLLPDINRALAAMNTDGSIKTIVEAYTR